MVSAEGPRDDPWWGLYALTAQESWGGLARGVLGYTALLLIPAMLVTAVVYVLIVLCGASLPTVGGGGTAIGIAFLLVRAWRQRRSK